MNLQLERDNEQISSKILDLLNFKGLQAYLSLPKPQGAYDWSDEQWAYHKRDAFINRIYSFVALLETAKHIGWVEHTCDWDLGITVVLKDGTEWSSGQGSDTIKFKISGDEILDYKDQRLSCSNMIEKLVIESFELKDDDDDYEIVNREFPIMDIDEIRIWD